MEINKKIDALHLKFGCKLLDFEGGARLPISYSDRLSEEINLLLSGCGLFDLKSCWLIALNGEEARSFLQGMVTSDVFELAIGDVQSSLICDSKGKILYHLKILRSREKELIVICDPGQGKAVGKILDNFHVREKLELRLLNKSKFLRIDLIGPDSPKILEKYGYNIGKNEWNFEESTVLTFQYNLGKICRLINLVKKNIVHIFIEKIIKNNNSGFISLQSFDEIRISEGITRFGVDYSNTNFPQEAGLGDHISYKKGCYIGQEPHSRMFHRGHPNWRSVWLNVPENYKTKIRDGLFHNSKRVGEITSLRCFAMNGFFQGIGMIRDDFAKEEILLSLSEDSITDIRQNHLPFNINRNDS